MLIFPGESLSSLGFFSEVTEFPSIFQLKSPGETQVQSHLFTIAVSQGGDLSFSLEDPWGREEQHLPTPSVEEAEV